MFLLRMIRYILGYVRFTASGGCPEKFMNAAAQSGVILWDIRSREGVLHARVLAKNYKRLRQPAAAGGVRLDVKECTGLPFRVKKYGRRWGILFGAVLTVAALWFFSSFIWTVNISGNSTTSAAEISDVLSDLGLRPGAFPAMLNVKKIEQEAMLRLPGLSWIAVNIDGSEADVKVRERVYPPDVVPTGVPCNVKAAQAGQIVKLEVYQGKAMVKVGDTVAKDGLIISGVVTDKNGGIMLLHASGKATARTQRELSVTVPYRQRVKVETGSVVNKNTLGVFSFSIPLYFSKPAGDYRITLQKQQLEIMGMKLPFSLTKRSYIGLKEADVTYTKAQAQRMAAAQLKEEAATELAGARILSSSASVQAGDTGYTLTGHYYCEEDIAFEEAIAFS